MCCLYSGSGNWYLVAEQCKRKVFLQTGGISQMTKSALSIAPSSFLTVNN